jgi:DNA polymerase-3 subunit epsilon
MMESYLRHFENTWADDAPIDQVRFVVLDTETTGLDPRKDSIITIGAVSVIAGEILLDDSFEALLKISHNTSSVTVHGITRDEGRQGFDESQALELFLEYLRDGVIVGHHIGHDVTALSVACQRHFSFQLRNRFLDTMDLTLHLEKDGAFPGRERIASFTLEALCEIFGVIPHDRHTAPGDAFITAQVFLRLLRLANRSGRKSLGALSQPFPVESQGATATA